MNNIELEKRAFIVANDFKGIIPYNEAFYLHSIIYSASRCLDSFERFDKLKTMQGKAEDLVSLVQEAIGHSAALSRYFWPSESKYQKKAKPNLATQKERRSEKLRIAFGLDESSPLFNRSLRNAWEHFDERLDIYFLGCESGYFFPNCVLDNHNLANESIAHIFKLLDLESECLVLLGEKFFFSPIRGTVQTVLNLALEFDNNGGRLPETKP